MQDPNILNPLLNPIFIPVLWKTLIVYFAGFILLFVLNGFSLKNLFKKNIGIRYLSWLVIGPIYLLFVFLGGIPALFLLLSIMFLAINEVNKISKLTRGYIVSLYFLAVLSVVITSFFTTLFYSLPLIYFLVLSFVAIKENNAKASFVNCCIALFVSIWIVFSLSHFILLGHLNNSLDSSKSLLLLIGFAVPLSDVMAYVVGSTFSKVSFLDRLKVASNLSPKKSYAGSIGNVIGAGLGILIMYVFIADYVASFHWFIIAIIIGLAGLMGDITASMFKRYYGVKDSGILIPGHGGVIDRIDSTLRVIVILYYYLLFAL